MRTKAFLSSFLTVAFINSSSFSLDCCQRAHCYTRSSEADLPANAPSHVLIEAHSLLPRSLGLGLSDTRPHL